MNLRILCLCTIRHDDLPMKRSAFMLAAELLQLVNQLQRLLLRKRLAGRNGVNDQLQFREFKIMLLQPISATAIFMRNGKSILILQQTNIIIDAISFRPNATFAELLHDCRHRNRVFVVRFFFKYLFQIYTPFTVYW